MSKIKRTVSFCMGSFFITPDARDALSGPEVFDSIRRHAKGDWGDLGQEDWASNDSALTTGLRIISVYHSATGVKFYIITEADRSMTTVLLPDNY